MFESNFFLFDQMTFDLIGSGAVSGRDAVEIWTRRRLVDSFYMGFKHVIPVPVVRSRECFLLYEILQPIFVLGLQMQNGHKCISASVAVST